MDVRCRKLLSALPRLVLAAIAAALAGSPAAANVLYNSNADGSKLAKVGGSSCAYFGGQPSNGCSSPPTPSSNIIPTEVSTTPVTAIKGLIDDESHLFTTGYSSYLVASADLTGRMKIYGPPNPFGGVSPANAIGPGTVEGETELNDTITLNGLSPASDGLYHFTWHAHLDGDFTPVVGFDGTPNAPQNFGLGFYLHVFGATTCSQGYESTAIGPIDVTLSVNCASSSNSFVYDSDLGIYMRNLFADFGGTASIYLDPLPPGVTVTSASGVFLNSPVPEPGTSALLGTGLLAVCGVSRRRGLRGPGSRNGQLRSASTSAPAATT